MTVDLIHYSSTAIVRRQQPRIRSQVHDAHVYDEQLVNAHVIEPPKRMPNRLVPLVLVECGRPILAHARRTLMRV